VRRAGYTLVEVIAVVALIGLIAAITLPSIAGMFSDARIDAAGDMIRARMADARSMAMEHNKSYRFGFIPGTGKFQIAPDDSDLWHGVQDSAPVETDEHVRGELPEEIVFATDPGALSDAGGSAAAGSWHLGGVFHPDGTARGELNPDGTADDDVTFYFGKAGYSPRGVRMRGLTSIIRVFDPTADEGLHP